MRNTRNYLMMSALVLIVLSACKKDDKPAVELPLPASSGRVLISCEGSFGSVNASISAYSTLDNSIVNNVFSQVNMQDLGDVLQSLEGANDKVYAVVNNSSKIEVMDKEGLIREIPITGLLSPRFILPIDSEKAYVSDLFSGSISVVDLLTKSVTDVINVNAWTEEMLRDGDFAYVTAADKDKLYVVNVNTDMVVDSIQVTLGPIALSIDSQGKLWVLCNGYFGVVPPELHRIDLSTSSVMASMTLPAPFAYQMKMAMNPAKDRVYVMNNTVFSMGINQTTLSTTPVVPFPGNAYGLGVSPFNGDIYVGDAPDFSNPGKVFRYSSSGAFIDSMQVGIAPNGFLFQ